MSVLTMYPVQSMRKFVCDRLTVAAQEILGAFEKRVDEYEAELARQRRMLDTAFSSEIKLQRAEIKALLNQQQQQQQGSNGGGFRFPPDTAQIKDELEEISISQERPLPPKQQEASASRVTSASDPNASGDQSQSSGPEKESRANKDPSFNSSNTGVESGSKEGTWLGTEQPVSQNSGRAETLNDHRLASPAEPTEPTSAERSQALATTEETFDDAFLDANYEDIFDESAFALSGMSPEPSLNMSFDDLNVTPASITEQTQLEKDNVESTLLTGSPELTQTLDAEFPAPTASHESAQARTCTGDNNISAPRGNCEPEANMVLDENPALTRSVEATQPEENPDWRPASPILTAPRPDDESQGETPAAAERVEGGDGRRAFSASDRGDKSSTSTESVEPTSHKKKQDMSASPTKSTEQASSQGSTEESVTSADGTEHASKKKQKEERTSSHRSTDPSLKKKSKNGKILTSEGRPHKKHRQESGRSVTDKTLSSAAVADASCSTLEPMQNQRSDGEKTTPIESADQEPNIQPQEEKETSNPRLSSAQNDEHGDAKAASTGDSEMGQNDNGEKTETVASKPSSDGKKAASHSKPKHKSSDRSPGKSKLRTSVRKCYSEDAQSKEATSTNSDRDGQGCESPQKRLRKEESSMSSRSGRTKNHDKHSKENTTSNQDPDPPLSNTEDSGSSDGEEKAENPYKCDRCGKVMSNFKNYKFHMKSHTVAKTYKCDTCGKMFRESWDLNKHSVIHAAEKPYKCDVCGNGFNRRYNLDLHVRVHTGEKPYQCNTCGKSFSSCVNMKKHMRIHTGEKPYTCKDCGKEFADSSAFKNHQRVHTGEKPFKCSYCKRKFATRTTLKRHIRTHTGEKPYKCTVCDRNFGHRTDLKGHMRMHTGEKPYKCSTCGEEFSSWSKLNKHKRVHSGEAQDSTE